MIWSFEVKGPLLGYRASIRRAHDPKYKCYKQAVGILAIGARVDLDKPTDESPVWVGVEVYWKGKPRIDFDNVTKAIIDSMYPSDRYVYPGKFQVHPHSGVEKAVVYVERKT